MKKILIVFCSILCNLGLFAQKHSDSNGSINGCVIDSLTNLPVNYATISVFKQGQINPINGGSSDTKGNFEVSNLPSGEYRVTIDFMGYDQKQIDHVVVNDDNKHKSLGTLLFLPTTNQLNDVTVISNRPIVENKIDKLIYNPINDLSVQGGVLLDVLKKVPELTVDIDGNVELQGNGNIRFLINGKPSSIFGASLTDALQSIPASQIKSIEVISSPGAKYDASGTGGIINIILKDSKIDGTNGNVNISAGTRLQTGSFNLNYHKGNVGVNAFFSGNAQLNSTTLNSIERNSMNSLKDTTTHLFQNGNNNFKREGYQSGLSVDWKIASKDELTATFGLNHFGNNSNGITEQQETTTDASNTTLSNILSTRYANSKFKENSTDFSLAYKKTFNKKDQELDILYTSSLGANSIKFLQTQQYSGAEFPLSGISSNNPGKDRETDISIDYVLPINESVTIETGGKAVIENINNSINTDTLLNNGQYGPDANQSYGFNYNRKVLAYYLSSSFSFFNGFIEGKAGLRYEFTHAIADFANTHIPDYGILAPSFVLSHKFDDQSSIKLSYSYRLERPDYGDLNPFYNISDPHNISTGNPNLKPELGHNYELGYNRVFNKNANVYIAAFYKYNTNDIQSYTTFYPVLVINNSTYSNVSLNQRYNVGREVNTGTNIYISFPVTDKFSLRSNMLFADRITNNPGSSSVSGFMYRVNLNASYEFAHNLAAEVFGNYRSSQRTIQGHSPSFMFYTIAARKQFLNKRASIGITASNPFNQYINQNSVTSGTNFNQKNIRQMRLRSFGISFSYRFGKLDFKKEENNSTIDLPGGIDG